MFLHPFLSRLIHPFGADMTDKLETNIRNDYTFILLHFTYEDLTKTLEDFVCSVDMNDVKQQVLQNKGCQQFMNVYQHFHSNCFDRYREFRKKLDLVVSLLPISLDCICDRNNTCRTTNRKCREMYPTAPNTQGYCGIITFNGYIQYSFHLKQNIGTIHMKTLRKCLQLVSFKDG